MLFLDYDSAFAFMMTNSEKGDAMQYLFKMGNMPTGVEAFMVVDGTLYASMRDLGHTLRASVPAVAPVRSSVVFDAVSPWHHQLFGRAERPYTIFSPGRQAGKTAYLTRVQEALREERERQAKKIEALAEGGYEVVTIDSVSMAENVLTMEMKVRKNGAYGKTGTPAKLNGSYVLGDRVTFQLPSMPPLRGLSGHITRIDRASDRPTTYYVTLDNGAGIYVADDKCIMHEGQPQDLEKGDRVVHSGNNERLTGRRGTVGDVYWFGLEKRYTVNWDAGSPYPYSKNQQRNILTHIAKMPEWSWVSTTDPTARKDHWVKRSVSELPAEPETLQVGQRVTYKGPVPTMQDRSGTVVDVDSHTTTRYRIQWDRPSRAGANLSSEVRGDLMAHYRPTQQAKLAVGSRVVYTGTGFGANHELIGEKGTVVVLGSVLGSGSATVRFDNGNVLDMGDDCSGCYQTSVDRLTLLAPWED